MRPIKDIAIFLAGFVIATATCVLVRASTASAQSAMPDTSITAPTRPTQQGTSTRARAPAAAPVAGTASATADTADDSIDREAAGTTSTPSLVPQSRNNTAAAPGSDRTGPQDGDNAARFIPTADLLDGEPERNPLAGQIADGRAENPAIPVTPTPDGDTGPHGRQRADRDAFALTTYDAIAFQIEPNPAADPRPGRLARLEPYSPRGVRAGSWVILPDIDAGAGYTSNALASPQRRATMVYDIAPTLRAVTDWSQHALDFRATGLASRYPDETLADQRTYGFEARGRIDVSRRTNVEVLVARRHDADSPGDPFDPAATAGRAPFDTNQAAVTFNQTFNRVTLQLRGAVTETAYQPTTSNSGASLNNIERDNTRRDLAFRASYSFKPALAMFAEYAVNDIAYRTTALDGILRDSRGDRARLGLSFGNTGRIWRGELAVGYGRQDSRDAALQDAGGIILDANLAWRPTELTSVLFQARTDFTTSTEAGQGLGRQQIVGIELRHAFQRHLIGNVGVTHQIANFEGITLTETQTTANIGAEYWISNATSLTARYSHLWFNTTAASGDYQVDTVRVGMRWRP